MLRAESTEALMNADFSNPHILYRNRSSRGLPADTSRGASLLGLTESQPPVDNQMIKISLFDKRSWKTAM